MRRPIPTSLRHDRSGTRWQLEHCRRFWSRLRGLSGRPVLDATVALHLPACRAIHSFGMRQSIDVAFCDRDGRVLQVVIGLPPRRLAAALRARQVFEFRAGEFARVGLCTGDHLCVEASLQ